MSVCRINSLKKWFIHIQIWIKNKIRLTKIRFRKRTIFKHWNSKQPIFKCDTFWSAQNMFDACPLNLMFDLWIRREIHWIYQMNNINSTRAIIVESKWIEFEKLKWFFVIHIHLYSDGIKTQWIYSIYSIVQLWKTIWKRCCELGPILWCFFFSHKKC